MNDLTNSCESDLSKVSNDLDKIKFEVQNLNDELNRAKTEYEGGYRDWETDRKSTRLNSSHRL